MRSLVVSLGKETHRDIVAGMKGGDSKIPSRSEAKRCGLFCMANHKKCAR